jgi:hypothetical protein
MPYALISYPGSIEKLKLLGVTYLLKKRLYQTWWQTPTQMAQMHQSLAVVQNFLKYHI